MGSFLLNLPNTSYGYSRKVLRDLFQEKFLLILDPDKLKIGARFRKFPKFEAAYIK